MESRPLQGSRESGERAGGAGRGERGVGKQERGQGEGREGWGSRRGDRERGERAGEAGEGTGRGKSLYFRHHWEKRRKCLLTFSAWIIGDTESIFESSSGVCGFAAS